MDDTISRWLTDRGAFRLLAARSTETVREAARVAGASPAVADLYGRLLTGAALMQLALSPGDRVQCSLSHGGASGGMLADVWPGPDVRGRVDELAPISPGPAFSAPGEVLVSRQPARGGEVYQSVIPTPDGSVADALQRFALESDQVLTVFSLVTVPGDAGVERAAGLLVQGLPGMGRDDLEAVTACLERSRFDERVAAGEEPDAVVEAMFAPVAPRRLATDRLRYRCRCTQEAAVAAVRTLGSEAVARVRAGATESVTCEFCHRVFVVGPDQLRGEVSA